MKFNNDGMFAYVTQTGNCESTVSDIYIINMRKLIDLQAKKITIKVACTIEEFRKNLI